MMNNLPKFLRNPKLGDQMAIDSTTEPYNTLMACWLIEMAISLGWFLKTRSDQSPPIFGDIAFLRLTGIRVPMRQDEFGDKTPTRSFVSKLTDERSLNLLKTRLLELQAASLPDDLPLFLNIAILEKLLGLSEADQAVLTFGIFLSEFPLFRNAIQTHQEVTNYDRLAKIIATVSGHPEAAIRKALHEDSPLTSTGLMTFPGGSVDLEEKINLTDCIGPILLHEHNDENDLIKKFLKAASPPTLDMVAFPHLAHDIDAMSAYLRNAIQNREPGINILFYGPPGTGKTELVKVLAADLGLDLFESAFSDEDGNPIKGDDRLRAYNFIQKIVAKRPNTLLMFDEIEDIFESRGLLSTLFEGEKKEVSKGGGKAWINRTLERNATAAIWITNDQNIDEAYLRRFDYPKNLSCLGANG